MATINAIKENVFNAFKAYSIKGILADIGVSSLQLDKQERGFGFESSTLDMRMNQNAKLSAKTIINEYEEADLARIFYDYGELSGSYRLAKEVVKARTEKQIETIDELKQIFRDYPELIIMRPIQITGMETTDNSIRHPKYVGFRDDIPLTDCIYSKIFGESNG